MKHGTSVPRAQNEKSRLYEWMVLMFDKEIPNRVLNHKDGDDATKLLTTKLKKNEINSNKKRVH